jgi:hypothetical protein
MPPLTRSVKIGIAATLVSLFVYNAYVTRGSYVIFYGFLSHDPSWVSYVDFTGVMFWFGHVGLTLRFAGLMLGLASVFLLWMKNWSFSRVRLLIAAALFLEALYFVGNFPSGVRLLTPSSLFYVPFLGVVYVLQAVVLVPLLVALSFMVGKSRGGVFRGGFWRLAGAAFVAYVSALAINAVFRWLDMLSLKGFGFLTDIIALGFVSAVVLMPLAVAFALLGEFCWTKANRQSALRWVGASLTSVGLYYAIYLVYSYFANSLNYLPLVDVWTIPLLGLGLTLVWQSKTSR